MYFHKFGPIAPSSFYDPNLNDSFSMSDRESKWWSVGAEPIWVTNQLQKRGAQSGIFFWPGSEAAIKGVTPTYFKRWLLLRACILNFIDCWFRNVVHQLENIITFRSKYI